MDKRNKSKLEYYIANGAVRSWLISASWRGLRSSLGDLAGGDTKPCDREDFWVGQALWGSSW